MKDLKIDTDGDILLSDLDEGIELIESEEDDLRQSIKIILETKIGEYKFDEELGMSHLNLASIGGKNPLNHYLAQDIQDALITQDERISNVTIEKTNFNSVNRKLEINILIESLSLNNEININSEVNLDGI